jgi:hypothetical protein
MKNRNLQRLVKATFGGVLRDSVKILTPVHLLHECHVCYESNIPAPRPLFQGSSFVHIATQHNNSRLRSPHPDPRNPGSQGLS